MADDELLVRLDERLAEVEARLGTHTEVWEGIRLDMRQREERWIRIYRDESAKTQTSYDRMMAALDDLREESVAGRKAILAMLDRLPPPDAPGA